jgi:outer membrane protein insertion porin family
MKLLLLIVMLACAAGFGQTGGKALGKAATAGRPAAAGGQRWTIASLTIEGNRNFTREQVLAIARLRVGQTASKADFEAARDRLVACGAFESVAYRYAPPAKGDGMAATIELAEVEQVYPVDFQDLHVSSLDLDEALRAKDPLYSREKMPATQPVLQRYTKWIQEYLDAKGVKEKVGAGVMPSEAGEYAIVFRPDKPLPTVAQVTFEGNQLISQDKLREAIAGAVGASYTEDSFRQILNSVVRPLYEKQGHLRVTFPELRTKPAEDVQGLHVFVTVDEGETYELGKVTIEGPSPIPAETLVKAGEFKPGEPVDMSHVNDGVERIRKTVRREGYMEVRVSAERHLDHQKKQVNIALKVAAGPQFTMGKLNINGLDLNSEPEIRRIWILKEGKPFNPDYPDLFLRRIREQGMFDNLGATKAEYQLNQKDHTADVTLTFGGKAPAPGPGRGGRGGRGRGVE